MKKHYLPRIFPCSRLPRQLAGQMIARGKMGASMKQFNRKTGALAEDIATVELRKKGYKIFERNFSNKFGEIDIIAKDREVLVFVEVKAKIGTDFGMPEEMVGKGKLQKIRNMATMYMNGQELPCRIDIVAIVLDEFNDVVRLTHYENVY